LPNPTEDQIKLGQSLPLHRLLQHRRSHPAGDQ